MLKKGQRIKIDLASYELSATWPTPYGNCFLYKFTDKENNVYIWKSQKYVDKKIKELTARFVEQIDYGGQKENVINYCRVN